MAIDTPLDSASRKQHYARQQQAQKFVPVGAGSFQTPATMSRIGVTQRPLEFTPNEKAKKLLEDFFIQTGKRLEVRPGENPGGGRGSGYGYYQPVTEEGGSLDPRRRVVYLDPENASLHTLIHEAGHAQDPMLYEAAMNEKIGRDNYYGTVVEGETLGDNLRRFMSMGGPLGRLQSETIAQKYVVDYLKDKGYTDDQIKSMESLGGDYGRYPYQYVDEGFRYREGLSPEQRVTMPDANTVDMAEADFLRNRLNHLYTTPGYLDARDAIASEALAYLEDNLGRFTDAGDKKPREIYTRTVFDY